MSSYTPAQVGAANIPDVHMDGAAPQAQHVVDFTGDEFDSLPVSSVPSSARNWRSRDETAAAVGIGLGTDQTTRANEHAHGGAPDARRTETAAGGHPGSPENPSLSPSPEYPHNDRDVVYRVDQSAPSRPRQGFTGDDPARAAQSQRAWFLRPFDQWAAYGAGPVEKVGQDNPTASRPPARSRLVGGLPSPSGSEGTGMEAVGSQANTFRRVPRPWDELALSNGQEVTPARAAGWRAR